MQFLASLPTYGHDQAVKNIWSRFKDQLGDVDGICYYKHPVITSTTRSVPDLTLLANGFQPLVIKSLDLTIDDIDSIEEMTWTVKSALVDSPVLELDDYVIGLQHKFDKERVLRHRLEVIGVIAFPLISKGEFETRFNSLPEHIKAVWADLDIDTVLTTVDAPLDHREWLLAKSVFQGVSPLNKGGVGSSQSAETLGEAIKILDKEIALLDEEQHKVAIQIAPGPQRIRGLAGTGKTVVLAMKAANLHLRYPEKRILFTFHTQSLYNQARNLITKFYRIHSESDPDWDKLHVRHGWGGAARPGVYTDVCKRYGATPMPLTSARTVDPAFPFRACCNQALQLNIKPYYHYILVDEAQDFPREFFQMLYRLAPKDKCIYWAYDELQSLSNTEVPSPTELFGTDAEGIPLVSLEGDEYEGGIEKDFVLHRSYRCPQEVLMLAHAIGLGIHSIRGSVQMLANKSSWTSVGYEIVSGDLVAGQETIILRPPENSPNRINQIYKGGQKVVQVGSFDDRNSELAWVAQSIAADIANENIRPEQIVVISLDSKNAKRYLMRIQKELLTHQIGSTIPGLIDDTAEFAEPGMVTLSTVYRAKGNEAPVVYIVSFDSLYEYAEELERRNQAFASISRSKGWVRITGTGKPMTAAKVEIDKILADIPYFRFVFPDMEHLRRLDASETTRRRREVKTAKDSISKLLGIEADALHALPSSLLRDLKRKLDEVSDED